jgi:hypothetical protein
MNDRYYGNVSPIPNQDRDAMRRAERVLHKHGVKDERTEYAKGCRPGVAIDAIIRDVQAANAEADDE